MVKRLKNWGGMLGLSARCSTRHRFFARRKRYADFPRKLALSGLTAFKMAKGRNGHLALVNGRPARLRTCAPAVGLRQQKYSKEAAVARKSFNSCHTTLRRSGGASSGQLNIDYQFVERKDQDASISAAQMHVKNSCACSAASLSPNINNKTRPTSADLRSEADREGSEDGQY
ncbi:MAG: hypothetical protein EOP62_13965 [Sphingomonadales bacterium]|nr:MAG: hypothetical protein EOP62_13965 [Sphingomonadales bacterium]